MAQPPLSQTAFAQRGRFKALLGTLLAPALWVPASSRAAPPAKVLRIGYLSPGMGDLRRLKPALEQLGYIEGTHVIFVVRVGPHAELDALAIDLVAARPDLIVGSTNVAISALQRATRDIPIVMMWTAAPVEYGFIQSLARPGGNITGAATAQEHTNRKLVEVGSGLAPARVIGQLISPTIHPLHSVQLQRTERAAKELGLSVASYSVGSGATDLDDAFRAAARAGVRIMVVSSGPPFVDQAKAIAEVAIRHRIGTGAVQAVHVKNGLLFSYGMNVPMHYHDVAAAVDRIANGAAPATLPVTLPIQFELTINERTAKLIGMKIPPALQITAEMVR